MPLFKIFPPVPPMLAAPLAPLRFASENNVYSPSHGGYIKGREGPPPGDPPGTRTIVDYGEGIFDNKPDKPGQGQIRKKIFGLPLELVLPTRFVKVLAETVAGADMPPGVHRTEGGRGTGVAESEELNKIDAERRRAAADAERRRLQAASPFAAALVGTRAEVNPALAAFYGVYLTGLRGAIRAFTPGATALQLADLGARLFGPLTRGTVVTAPAVVAAAGAVAAGSIQPALIQPHTGSAIRNAGGKSGINAELVHERADP